MDNSYKRTVAGSVGAGMASVFNAAGRQYYVLEHKTESQYHHIGESQKIIVDQIELGRDASCQVRFDETLDCVSRRHAAIEKVKDGWRIINLSQTNPTFVNGQPVQEWNLSSGDEIRLSSKGPVIGFIIPQGKQSMVSSIGLTERMNLFRKQALRPYKAAIIIMGVVLVLAVCTLIGWNVYTSKEHEKQMFEYQQQIKTINGEIQEKDALIIDLHDKLENMDKDNVDAYNFIAKQVEKLREEKKELEKRSQTIQSEFSKLKQENKEKEDEAAIKAQQELERQMKEQEKEAQEEEKANMDNPSVEDIIKEMQQKEPELPEENNIENIIKNL